MARLVFPSRSDTLDMTNSRSPRVPPWATRFTVAAIAVMGVALSAGTYPRLGPGDRIVTEEPEHSVMPLVHAGQAAAIFLDRSDHAGVRRAAGDLQADIERVTGVRPELHADRTPTGRFAVIVGTLGKNPLLDRLAASGKIPGAEMARTWESFLIAVVASPVPGVEQALVIAGSDRRGTIYGIYEVSEQVGVSPWHWWADVPARRKDHVFVRAGTWVEGGPAVKYRGIFINNEEPAFAGWAREKFGGVNAKMYAHLFELILRLRGNCLWPSMWGKAFNEDDPENPRLADEYGIVMGTSHHEPMMRSQKEWTRNRQGYGNGEWNYVGNQAGLLKFWDDGIARNRKYENLVTLGMRGHGDKPMDCTGGLEENRALLESLIDDQRRILARHMGPDLTGIPQLWTLYNEVQKYYDAGMRVPDNVTLLFCDDNQGNVRRLPTPEERKRAGGTGMYYHFDAHTPPRCYTWINTVTLGKTWEQMNLAYEHGIRQLWMVNVGDLKPIEVPTEFFLRMAWNPEAIAKQTLDDWLRSWAEREFGKEHAAEVAGLYDWYTAMNGCVRPEFLSVLYRNPYGTYSQVNYREADEILSQCRSATARAEALAGRLPAELQDAYFQLILYPVKATAMINQLYILAGRNRLYAEQGRPEANDLAAQVRALFAADAELSDHYNNTLAGGKWRHMMNQVHIGYSSWKPPKANVMPELKEVVPAPSPMLGVAVEGSPLAWPPLSSGKAQRAPRLPDFDSVNRQSHFIDVFNRGAGAIQPTFSASQPWVKIDAHHLGAHGGRVWVSIDWSRFVGDGEAEIAISEASISPPLAIGIRATKFADVTPGNLAGFMENAGVVSLHAEHYAAKTDGIGASWQKIKGSGRTPYAMTILPTTAESVMPGEGQSPCLEYRIYLSKPGKVNVNTYVSPSLNVVAGRGLRYAVAIDDEAPQVMDVVKDVSEPLWKNHDWAASVKAQVRVTTSEHRVEQAGYHTVRIWMVDPGIVLQKIVVDAGGLRPSHLGPPESLRNP